MTQTLHDKMTAIESLLGFLFAYRDHIPGAARTARQEWVSEPSPLDEPVKPRPLYNLNCSGKCDTCLSFYAGLGKKPQCPPEELWVREYKAIRARYRIEDLERALLDLGKADVAMAQAVWAVWVEPWPDPKTEPIAPHVRHQRQQLAARGLEWLADAIDGEVYGYAEKPPMRDNQIRQLAAQGFTRRRIARELRCSLRDVQRVLKPEESAVRG